MAILKSCPANRLCASIWLFESNARFLSLIAPLAGEVLEPTIAFTARLLCCSHGSTELYDEANRQQLAEEQAPERSEESERLGP